LNPFDSSATIAAWYIGSDGNPNDNPNGNPNDGSPDYNPATYLVDMTGLIKTLITTLMAVLMKTPMATLAAALMMTPMAALITTLVYTLLIWQTLYKPLWQRCYYGCMVHWPRWQP